MNFVSGGNPLCVEQRSIFQPTCQVAQRSVIASTTAKVFQYIYYIRWCLSTHMLLAGLPAYSTLVTALAPVL